MQNNLYQLCHFHYVDSALWMGVQSFIQKMMVSRVIAGNEFFTAQMNREEFDGLGEFLHQMDTAYLHPRRDSLHIKYCEARYGTIARPLTRTLKPLASTAKPVFRFPANVQNLSHSPKVIAV